MASILRVTSGMFVTCEGVWVPLLSSRVVPIPQTAIEVKTRHLACNGPAFDCIPGGGSEKCYFGGISVVG